MRGGGGRGFGGKLGGVFLFPVRGVFADGASDAEKDIEKDEKVQHAGDAAVDRPDILDLGVVGEERVDGDVVAGILLDCGGAIGAIGAGPVAGVVGIAAIEFGEGIVHRSVERGLQKGTGVLLEAVADDHGPTGEELGVGPDGLVLGVNGTDPAED